MHTIAHKFCVQISFDFFNSSEGSNPSFKWVLTWDVRLLTPSYKPSHGLAGSSLGTRFQNHLVPSKNLKPGSERFATLPPAVCSDRASSSPSVTRSHRDRSFERRGSRATATVDDDARAAKSQKTSAAQMGVVASSAASSTSSFNATSAAAKFPLDEAALIIPSSFGWPRSWTELGVDMFESITGFLAMREITRASSTCRTWRRSAIHHRRPSRRVGNPNRGARRGEQRRVDSVRQSFVRRSAQSSAESHAELERATLTHERPSARSILPAAARADRVHLRRCRLLALSAPLRPSDTVGSDDFNERLGLSATKNSLVYVSAAK
jgi:hypothetical protein